MINEIAIYNKDIIKELSLINPNVAYLVERALSDYLSSNRYDLILDDIRKQLNIVGIDFDLSDILSVSDAVWHDSELQYHYIVKRVDQIELIMFYFDVSNYNAKWKFYHVPFNYNADDIVQLYELNSTTLRPKTVEKLLEKLGRVKFHDLFIV